MYFQHIVLHAPLCSPFFTPSSLAYGTLSGKLRFVAAIPVPEDNQLLLLIPDNSRLPIGKNYSTFQSSSRTVSSSTALPPYIPPSSAQTGSCRTTVFSVSEPYRCCGNTDTGILWSRISGPFWKGFCSHIGCIFLSSFFPSYAPYAITSFVIPGFQSTCRTW